MCVIVSILFFFRLLLWISVRVVGVVCIWLLVWVIRVLLVLVDMFIMWVWLCWLVCVSDMGWFFLFGVVVVVGVVCVFEM